MKYEVTQHWNTMRLIAEEKLGRNTFQMNSIKQIENAKTALKKVVCGSVGLSVRSWGRWFSKHSTVQLQQVLLLKLMTLETFDQSNKDQPKDKGFRHLLEDMWSGKWHKMCNHKKLMKYWQFRQNEKHPSQHSQRPFKKEWQSPAIGIIAISLAW